MIWLGLFLALVSAVLVNLGLYVEHQAVSAAATLRLARPLASLWQLLRNPLWLTGYVAGWVGWGSYIAALWFAPLSLVQGVAAAGVGVLALLVWRFGGVVLRPAERLAVGASLVALVLIAATAGAERSAAQRQAPGEILVTMAVVLALGGLVALVAARRSSGGSALGAFAGVCYVAGDVATKAAVDRDGWVFVVLLVAMTLLAFALLQLSFQRGSALGTAGVATVLTNALPVAAALAVFGERLPAGPLGVLQVAALVAAIASAGVLAGTPPEHAAAVPASAAGGRTVPAGVLGPDAAGTGEEWG